MTQNTLKGLTQTQVSLLSSAMASGGRGSIGYGGGVGAKGGRSEYGARKHHALMGLVQKGVVEITHSDKETDTSHGHTKTYREIGFRIRSGCEPMVEQALKARSSVGMGM